MANILLVEPAYKNKYPPLGLMKLSTFHKNRNDEVVFTKGCSEELKKRIWDRIYISSLFTFNWNITIETILFYLQSVIDPKDIFVGGVMATLMKDDIYEIANVTIIQGLLNEKGKIGYSDDEIIDCITPDYSIIDTVNNPYLSYSYPTSDSYIAYATRGCIRKCPFCAVPIIEPKFSNSLSIAQQVNTIRDQFGEKRNLLLMDNNILASENFPQIIEEIKSIGFQKGATFSKNINGRTRQLNRFVDFNQGIDARLLTREKMKLLSEIAISPLRIAFDDIKNQGLYIEKIKLAAEFNIETLSNYILFNFTDTPKDFYDRLRINIELNEEFSNKGLKSQIWSFPMKYSPISGKYCKNRKFVGENWNKKYLRAIQCILLSTHGVVGPKKDFFEKAFGKNFQEFLSILELPEVYIVYRNINTENGNIENLRRRIQALDENQRDILWEYIYSNNFEVEIDDEQIKEIIDLYKHHS